MSKKRRRRKLKKRPFIILLVVFLCLILIGIYFYTHSDKYLFLKGLDRTYGNISNISDTFINNYIPYINSDYYNKTDSSINVVTSELDTNITFRGDIYLTDASNYYDLNIAANKTDYELEMLSKNNKLYYKIDDSKYYYTDYSDSNSSSDKYLKLLSAFIRSFKSNVKKNDLKSTSMEITINSKTYNTKKITFYIDDDNYKSIIKSFYSDIKNDDEMLDMFFSMTDYSSKEELIAYLEGNTISLDSSFGTDSLEYSIYLYKSNPIKNEISYTLEDVTCSLAFIYNDDYIEFDSSEGESNSYIKFSDNKIDSHIDGIGYATGEYSDNSFNVDFVDYDKEPLGNIKYSIEKDGSKYKTSLLINLDLSEIEININSSNEIEIDKAIPDIDVSNSIVGDNMPESDKKTLEDLLSITNDIFAF